MSCSGNICELRFSNAVPGPAAQCCLGAQWKCRFSVPLDQKLRWTQDSCSPLGARVQEPLLETPGPPHCLAFLLISPDKSKSSLLISATQEAFCTTDHCLKAPLLSELSVTQLGWKVGPGVCMVFLWGCCLFGGPTSQMPSDPQRQKLEAQQGPAVQGPHGVSSANQIIYFTK